MKDSRIILVCVLVSAVLSSCRPAVEPGTLAVWDGGRVTEKEMEFFMTTSARPRLRKDGGEDEQEVIRRLIRRFAFLKILASEATENEGENGTAPLLFLGPENRELLEYYVQRVGKVAVEVSDEEARGIWEKEKSTRFTLPEKMKFQYIFLRKDRHGPREIDGLVNKIEKELAVGRDFGDLAAEYSETTEKGRKGILGPVFRGKLDHDFEKQLYAHAGEKQAFRAETKNGVFVVQILEYTPERVIPFEEARAGIIRRLVNGKTDVQKEELMARLRKKYPADIDLDDSNGDGVVLSLDGKNLSKSRFEAYLASRNGEREAITEEARRKAAEELIERNLMILDALDRRLDQSEEFMRRREFQEILRKARRAREKGFSAFVGKIGDETIKADYQKRPERYRMTERKDLSWVFLPLGHREPFEILHTAEGFRDELERGASDEILETKAKEAGGAFFHRKGMSWEQILSLGPEISKAVREMYPGDVSDPVQLSSGLVILKVGKCSPARQLSWPEDRQLIREEYVRMHRKELGREFQDTVLKEHHFRILSADFHLPGEGPGSAEENRGDEES